MALVTALSMGASALQAQDKPMPMGAGKPMPMAPGDMGQMDPEMQAMMQEMHGMMQDMMGIHAYNPATLLGKKTDLALTKDQVTKLDNLCLLYTSPSPRDS